jgi:RHS repeat-associated protein
MGCLKLSYYQQERALEVNPNFYLRAVGKNGNAEKKRLSSSTYGFNGQEKDNEIKGSGNSYDMGARLYDPRIGRTPTIDPHASSYPAISPYAYVVNNPINAIDPDGRDVILLIDKQGAGGKGHMGMLYQDGNGSWYYFSQGATGNPSTSGMLTASNTGGGVTLIKLQVTETVALKDSKGNPILDANGITQTKQVTRDATKSEALAGAKSGQLGTAYDDSYTITTTSKEDALISGISPFKTRTFSFLTLTFFIAPPVPGKFFAS